MKLKTLLLCAMVVCSLSGCDWIKKQLGMATSSDIARLKLEMQQKAAREQQIKDSLETLRLDSLRLEQEKNVLPYSSGLDKRYYVIVGSFQKDFNAKNMVETLKKSGYSPVKIALKNGFDMVAIAGFDNYREARNEILKIEDYDLCPYDVWIYDVKQALHE